MSSKKRKRKKSRKPGHTPLSGHRKIGSTLVPPLAELPVSPLHWDRDLLPEYLWIASLREVVPQGQLYRPFYAFMDGVDEMWEEDSPAIGFLTDFSLLQKKKEAFLAKNEQLVRDLFLSPFGRILAFFPDSPASWLVSEFFLAEGGHLDPGRELGRLRSLVVDLLDGQGELATEVKMCSFGRVVKSGKMHFPRDMPTVDLLPKYPEECTPEERARVESFVRAGMSAYLSLSDREGSEWVKYFWRHNYDIAACKPVLLPLRGSKAVQPDELNALHERVNANVQAARSYLDRLAMRVQYDLYDPTKNEILHGLFARCTRFYLLVSENPSLWARDIAGILLRCLVETAITFTYLATRGTDDEFRKFREHGEAQQKLLMLHLQDSHPEAESLEGRTAEELAAEVGTFAAEVLQIELGNWAKKDTRKLAQETGLERFYRLVFTPTSADVHGTWASLKHSNLCVCSEPLHRYHLMPTYAEPPLYVTTLIAAQELLLSVHGTGVTSLDYPEDLELEALLPLFTTSDEEE